MTPGVFHAVFLFPTVSLYDFSLNYSFLSSSSDAQSIKNPSGLFGFWIRNGTTCIESGRGRRE